MSSKINVNYDQLLKDAVAQKQEEGFHEQARSRARQKAQHIVAKAMESRQNLRPGEDNYYGHILWSRLDLLSTTADNVKEVLSDVLDNSAAALEKAHESGASAQFMAVLTQKVQDLNLQQDAFSSKAISNHLSQSWAERGGSRRVDVETHRTAPFSLTGSETIDTYHSAYFWAQDHEFGVNNVRNALSLSHDDRLDDLLNDFQQGRLHAHGFLQKAKQVFIENLDTSMTKASEEISKSASIIDQYNEQWLAEGQQVDFKTYFTKKSSEDISKAAARDGDFMRLNSLLVRIRDMPDSGFNGVSLRTPEVLLADIEDALIASEVQAIARENEIAQNPAAPTGGTALLPNNFGALSTSEGASKEEPKPWYKKMFGNK